MTLPRTLDDLTPQWLTTALSSRAPGTVVDSVAIESVIWGTATKVFLKVTYADRGDDGPGEALCVKGGFQEELRDVAGVGYRLEAAFYRDIAAHLGVPLPACWFAAVDESANQGLFVTDDLRAHHAEFGRGGMHYRVDEVAAGLELQAIWHARTWDRSGPAAAPWLSVGSPFFRHAMSSMFHLRQHWDALLQLPQTDSLPDELRDRERVVAAMHRQWEIDDHCVPCLSHGDAHIGNTYRIPGQVAPRFLDWQVLSLGPWSIDVAYFMVGSLTIADRQRHEEELLAHYLDVLGGHGAPAPTFDEAMSALRRHHLHGVMWAFCPPQMQDPDGCAEMGRRHVQAAVDHETLAVLETGR
jgi:hypothetical protein